MAKKQVQANPGHTVVVADGEPLNLKNRTLAVVLAWLLPGAGHFYQGRRFKSVLFAVSIWSCFILGILIGKGRPYYFQWNDVEHRLQFFLQAGVGAPAIPAMVQWRRLRAGQEALWGGAFAAPRRMADFDKWHGETASGFDMGTLYTMVAGLLNFMAMFDAYAGPMPAPQKKNGNANESDDESLESQKRESYSAFDGDSTNVRSGATT